MNVTSEQARDSLNEIRAITQRMRKAVAAADASGHMMLWGLVWIGAFLTCGLAPERTAVAWAVGNTIGGIGSAMIGIWTSRTKIETADGGRQGRRVFGLWVALFVFVGVWMWLLRPSDNAQISAFICTAIMFLYVVMGLWFDAWFLVGLGLAVTVLTIVGYQVFPAHFYFWMAATGGGALFLAGLYINRAWR